jgi:hypothetical protein
MIAIAILDGFRTLAEVPWTPEQAEEVAAELMRAVERLR